MNKLKRTPYKLNVKAMINRLNIKSENEKIKTMRNLFMYKEDGIVPVCDLIEIIKACPVHDIFWKMHTIDIRTEDALFSYGKMVSLVEKCGMLRIDQTFRDMVNIQLEAIYKKLR